MSGYTKNQFRIDNDRKEFKKEFFIQKIYDKKNLHKLHSNAIYEKDKKTFAIYSEKDGLIGSKVLNEQVPRLLTENKNNSDQFAFSYNRGLNCVPSAFFFASGTLNASAIGFGFPMKLEPFLEEYLKKSIEFYLKAKDLDEESLFSEIDGSMVSIFKMMVCDRMMSNPKLFNKLKEVMMKDPVLEGGWLKRDNFIYEEILNQEVSNILEKYKIPENKFRDYAYKGDLNGLFIRTFGRFPQDQFRDGPSKAYRGDSFEDHIYLPIFIDHKEIPQLSWGHAKYAHYFNDKSFNFFKFKHADHLPNQGEIN